MTDDQVQDLKQFITTTVTQQTSDLREEFASLKGDFNKLEVKVDTMNSRFEQKFEDLELKVDTLTNTLHADVQDHEVRITRLEQAAA